MKRRLMALTLVVTALAATGCNQSDNDRTDRVEIDGVDCIVVRDGLGRIRRTDCDWGDR